MMGLGGRRVIKEQSAEAISVVSCWLWNFVSISLRQYVDRRPPAVKYHPVRFLGIAREIFIFSADTLVPDSVYSRFKAKQRQPCPDVQ